MSYRQEDLHELVKTGDYGCLYDAEYYRTGCGAPYERNAHWLTFFGNIAEEIIRALNPKRTLDAGCAWGFLVESLRDRGVEAFGVDISDYAISQARQDIRKYCAVGSLTAPIEDHYDLISCIEVLEHLPEDAARDAVANLCRAGDAILFSSTPDDFDEPTHVNVNDPIYWLRLFADNNFAPDLTFDAGFLTPHASLFRRVAERPDEAVLIAHGRKLLLANDHARLKLAHHDRGMALARLTAERDELRRILDGREQELKDLQSTHDELHALHRELAENYRHLEQGAAETRDELVRHQEHIVHMRDQHRALQHTADQTHATLNAIQNSTTWRLTAPLRLGVGGVKKILRPAAWVLERQDDSTDGRPRFTFPATATPPTGWLAVRLTGGAADGTVFWAETDDGLQPLAAAVIGNKGPIHHMVVRLPDAAVPVFAECQSTVPAAITARSIGRPGAYWRLGLERIAAHRRAGGSLTGLARRAWQLYRQDGLSSTLRRGLVKTETARTRYGAWLARHDRVTDADGQRIDAMIAAMDSPPLLSIVMPTYNSDPDYLRAAIASVRAQSYPHWQLCIADDASSDPGVRSVLDAAAAEDDRIEVVYRPENGHISAASNSALALAEGDYIVLMDHDDLLHPQALFMVAQTLVDDPDLDLVYTDEDKIDAQGRRFDPYFKPDWNPDLLTSQNYVSHLGVYRRRLIEEIGGFRIGYEGSQDYDLLLRFVERTTPERIKHIPHILYHWRAIAGSTALATDEKDYAVKRGLKALNDAFARRGIAGRVDYAPNCAFYRARYDLPDPLPRVSLIVPTRDRIDLLSRCIDGLLRRTDYDNLEILIVDNDSQEERSRRYFDTVADDARVQVLSFAGPFNYSAINNFAAEKASGSIIGLINNDLEIIHDDWLREMVSHVLRPEIGVVGARLYYPDDRVQHDGIVLGRGGVADYAHPFLPRTEPGYFGRSILIQNYSAVTAAALLVRKEVFDAVGGLDAENLPVAFNDVDFCLRVLEAGYRNLYTPYAELYHHESASRGADTAPDKIKRFHGEIAYMQTRWRALLTNDPAANPNFTLERRSFELSLERAAVKPWQQAPEHS